MFREFQTPRLNTPQIDKADSKIYFRGYADFMDVKGWNAMGWGNIGVTLGLFLFRVLYLAFGQDKVVNSTKKTMKKNV